MKLTVVQSNKSEKSGNFVTKLQCVAQVDLGPLGIKETKQTYYISAPQQVQKGQEIELDLNMFNIVEHPYSFTDEETGEITTIGLKWLHLK